MIHFQFTGPVLAIDHGMKVIGLAISRTGNFAQPFGLIYRRSKAQDFARINEIARQEKITALIVGLPPTPPDFVGHSQADSVRTWANLLVKAVAVPVYLWDEGLSSEDATALIEDAGLPRPERVDAHAAAVILQSCLDAVRNGHPGPDMVQDSP